MIKSVNPYDQQLIHCYDRMGLDEIEDVLATSSTAYKDWSLLPLSTRLSLIDSLKQVLQDRRTQCAQLITLEMGKLLVESLAEIDKCLALCEYYQAEAAQVLAGRSIETDANASGVLVQPLGPILGIMPWNFPFWQAFRFIIPTIIAGNTAVLKHASNVTGCALAIKALFNEAGFESGILKVLVMPGSEMEQVIQHASIKGVSITGSEAAGRQVARVAGECLKPMVLELGGSDPFIVFDDADLEQAVEVAIKSRFSNAGQSCIAAKRFIVHHAIASDFIDGMQQGLDKMILGNPRIESTTLAPLAMPVFVNDIHQQVIQSVKEGAKLCLGGEAWSENPAFYRPTILDQVTPSMLAGKEEMFGPVAAIMRFSERTEAISLANATRFGLGATVFTKDEDLALYSLNKIAAGSVFINGLMKSHPALPFGGVKASGFGRELSKEGLLAFVNVKTFWKK